MMNNLMNSKVGAVLAVGLVGGLGLYFASKKVSSVVGEVAEGLNPNSKDNIINRGVSAIGQTITGKANWSLGGAIYDMVNGSPSEQVERIQEDLFIKSIGG